MAGELLLVAAFACSGLVPVAALDNGVGRTPPMGWSSWQMFNRFVNETDMAESIVALARLKEFGYEYANFDGSWMAKERDPVTRKQMANPVTVPHGMKALADLAHSHGIKFGTYTAVGNVTCQGNPGSWGYEQLDMQQFAEWGVDYVKIDSCGGIPADPPVINGTTDLQRVGFERMRDALNATGRPVFINTCGIYGVSAAQMANKTSACVVPGEVGSGYTNDVDGWRADSKLVANSWLVEWANNLNSFFQAPCGRGWLTILDANQDLTQSGWAAPGGWNDMDIMSVGCSDAEKARGETHTDCNNGNQTLVEQASQFALWSMKSAPIILGGDLRRLSPEVEAIVTNKEMIALDQDPLGMPARIAFQGASQDEEGRDVQRTLLEVRECDPSDTFQQWKIGIVGADFSIENVGAGTCLSTTWADPVTVDNCSSPDATLFAVVRGAAAARAAVAPPGSVLLEVVKGKGDGGYAGRCLDVNHGVGPDVDLYACHNASHPDYGHQVFTFDSKTGMIRNAFAGKCLGLYGSHQPVRTLTIFTKKLLDVRRPRAVALFNRGDVAMNMTLRREHLMLDDDEKEGEGEGAGVSCKTLSLRDVEQHKTVAKGLSGKGVLRTVVVESHQTVVWRVECDNTQEHGAVSLAV